MKLQIDTKNANIAMIYLLFKSVVYTFTLKFDNYNTCKTH